MSQNRKILKKKRVNRSSKSSGLFHERIFAPISKKISNLTVTKSTIKKKSKLLWDLKKRHFKFR